MGFCCWFVTSLHLQAGLGFCWWSSPGFHGCCPLAVAAVLSCKVQADRWVAPHLAVRTLFDCCRWDCGVCQPVQRTPLWPASWLPAVDKGRGSKSVEVHRVWEVYHERLQFMSLQDAQWLSESLVLGLFGLVLLKLRLLMLLSSVADPLVEMLLMPMMLLMFSCTVILQLPLCLTRGARSKRW